MSLPLLILNATPLILCVQGTINLTTPLVLCAQGTIDLAKSCRKLSIDLGVGVISGIPEVKDRI